MPETLSFISDCNDPDQVSTEVVDNDFETGNITKFLSTMGENSQLMRLDVLEAMEHTIHKRSMRKAKEQEFNRSDEVLFRHPDTELSHFSNTDPFKPLNDVGVINEVLPGGIYKVEVTSEGEVVLKSVFSGQMVLFKANQHDLPHHEPTPKLSLMNVHNCISEFGLVVRKKIYNKGLRLTKHVQCGNTDSLCQCYCQVLDFGLLAMLSSLSDKEEEEAVFHHKFVSGLNTLQKSGFRYFLYGTIF